MVKKLSKKDIKKTQKKKGSKSSEKNTSGSFIERECFAYISWEKWNRNAEYIKPEEAIISFLDVDNLEEVVLEVEKLCDRMDGFNSWVRYWIDEKVTKTTTFKTEVNGFTEYHKVVETITTPDLRGAIRTKQSYNAKKKLNKVS